jgi:hypothetical protein
MSLFLQEAHSFLGGNSMEAALVRTPDRKPIEKLHVVRNFRAVIEARDMSLMKDELYQFLTLHCSFIAHFNMSGFKAAYSPPKDFAGVFIRHFDRGHSYFCDIYRCDGESYKGTGFTKAEIKKEFFRIVDIHNHAISMWAESQQRLERLTAYRSLKEEFEGTLKGIKLRCDGCQASYEVKVLKEGNSAGDFGSLHCLFCARDISL